VDRVVLSEVKSQVLAGVSRTGLSSQAGCGSDGIVSFHYVTIGDLFEHRSKCQSVRHLCPAVRAVRR